ncbi:MAG: hypothetical protein AAFO73_09635 [Pseudomonadota bacterium]
MTHLKRALCTLGAGAALLMTHTSHGFAATQLPKAVSSCGLHIDAAFREGAPVDRFSITNKSTPEWSITAVTVNLENSAGKLIFDTQDGGSGVEVFQPFRSAGGTAKLRWVSKLKDGGSLMTLDFNRFESKDSFTFSIDVDDTLKASDLGQIRVTDSEMAGATLTYVLRGPGGIITSAEADFGPKANSTLKGRAC